MHALASTRQLNRLNTYLVAASVAYCVAVVALLGPSGTVGLIWANCLNMALRIASSAYFIAEFQVNAPKCNLNPNPNVTPDPGGGSKSRPSADPGPHLAPSAHLDGACRGWGRDAGFTGAHRGHRGW